ncbi:MAG: hypothetical protein ACM3SS_20420 [Rhodospirillaceae bacterium]
MEPSSVTERSEWRAVARPLALLLTAFGAAWLYSGHTAGVSLGWSVALTYCIGLGWLARAVIGWRCGQESPMDARALQSFRDGHFWSRAARSSYAAVVVCDGLFLLDLHPDRPAVFFVFAALLAVFSVDIALLSIVVAAFALT